MLPFEVVHECALDVEPFATEPLPAFDCPMDSERPPAHAVSPAWPNATENRSNKQNNDVKAPRRALRVRPVLDRVPISEPPAFVAASVADLTDMPVGPAVDAHRAYRSPLTEATPPPRGMPLDESLDPPPSRRRSSFGCADPKCG